MVVVQFAKGFNDRPMSKICEAELDLCPGMDSTMGKMDTVTRRVMLFMITPIEKLLLKA